MASASLRQADQTVAQVRHIVYLGSAAALALIAAGVVLILRRGLRPLETMAAEADRISAGDLPARVSADAAGTEIARLGSALNGMLTRINAALDEQERSQEFVRRFLADASHELRTPLASLRTNAELYQQGAVTEPAAVREAMRRISLEAQRMSALVDDMLRLARLDQRPQVRREQVDLSALLAGCLDRARVTDPGRPWQARIEPGLVITGDPELLQRSVDNLLSNVRVHSGPAAAAELTAVRAGSGIRIEVSCTGPAVPADQLEQIFDRFYRIGAQQPGSGLGLAIVREVAAVHGGTACARLNDPGGLRIILTLPAPVAAAPLLDTGGEDTGCAREGDGDDEPGVQPGHQVGRGE